MKRIIPLLVICMCLCGCTPQVQPRETAPTQQTTETAEGILTTQPPEETLHSGLKTDGSFDEGTLFIGDSLTFGMVEIYLPDNGLLGEAKYMAIPGAATTCYAKGPALGEKPSAYSPEFEGMYMCQAVEKFGADYTAVYVMLGTNANEYATDQVYIDMVAHLLEYCPNATVYLQLVPNNRSERVNTEAANGRVQRAFAAFENEPRLQLIDTQTAIGYNLAPDGIHLVTKGQKCWYEALVAYAKEHEIGR